MRRKRRGVVHDDPVAQRERENEAALARRVKTEWSRYQLPVRTVPVAGTPTYAPLWDKRVGQNGNGRDGVDGRHP